MILAALSIALLPPAGQQVPGAAGPAVSPVVPPQRYLDALAAKGIAQVIAEAPAKGVVAPRPLSRPPTSDFYPPAALRAEQQGVSAIRCTLTVTGALENCSLKQSSGFPLLDAATLQMALYTRYSPRIVDRIPEASEVVLPVRWMIE
ncbi:energy transducer TonB [Sphingomonas sp. MMS12-HWE2-04]|uniref:energy transducer TonB n=1 Tax=Sphingomonas sp. MMS12-HWE2-04 TaxID=3234199 RepID=UPI00384E5FB8